MKGLWTWGVVVVLAAVTCNDSKEGEEGLVRAAFEELVRALEDKNGNALWEIGDDETHAFFEGLARRINQAFETIEQCYPEELWPQAKEAVGGRYMVKGGRGKDLFLALLEPGALRAPKSEEARTVLRVGIRKKSATVVTATHETYSFLQDREGRWKTDMLLKSFNRKGSFKALEKNLDELERACGSKEKEGAK